MPELEAAPPAGWSREVGGERLASHRGAAARPGLAEGRSPTREGGAEGRPPAREGGAEGHVPARKESRGPARGIGRGEREWEGERVRLVKNEKNNMTFGPHRLVVEIEGDTEDE